MGHFHGLLDLCCRIGKDFHVGAGCGPMSITGVAEQVSCTPEELHSRFLLLFLEPFGDGIKIRV